MSKLLSKISQKKIQKKNLAGSDFGFGFQLSKVRESGACSFLGLLGLWGLGYLGATMSSSTFFFFFFF